MQNPFTTTFSKAPEYTYISTEETAEIIDNFQYDIPSEAVYKITGVRGSGKTVILGKIEEAYQSEDNREKGWLVYRINPSRDMLKQLAAMMHKEPFMHEAPVSKSINLSASIMGNGAGIGISKTANQEYFDIGAELDDMIALAAENAKRILIGVDEVSKTKEMIVFASEFGKWLRAGYPVYMVCTGLYENIQDLCNVSNLTFFRRATTVKTTPLNSISMAEVYRSRLNIDTSLARELAEMTKGYAYAFQELGVIYFKKNENDSIENIKDRLRQELFAYSYEKIWEELSDNDRLLASLLTGKREYKREEILLLMEGKGANYSVYRDRLLKRGIITARQGYIALALPYFDEYIKEYCS